MIGSMAPPAGEMDESPTVLKPRLHMNAIIPRELQDDGGNMPAPRPKWAITTGEPPASGTLRSLPPERKPISKLSGDQNGPPAPSVPGNKRGSSESRLRTHK